MTQFNATGRVPQGGARARRFADAFSTYGGKGSLNVTHVFNNQGVTVVANGTGSGDEDVIRVEDDAGATVVGISDSGVSSPDPNKIVVNSNTSINSSVFNQIVSVNPSAATTITLSGASNFAVGTWIGFQDVSGQAGVYPISVNPNTAGSGFTLNGSNAAATVLQSNYGTSYIRLLRESGGTNWFLEQGAGSVAAFGNIRSASVNTTMVYPDIMILMNTSGGDRCVWLPDAAEYTKTVIYIKKISTDSNNFLGRPKVNSGQLIDGEIVIGDTVDRRTYTLISDGSDWWITGSHGVGSL